MPSSSKIPCSLPAPAPGTDFQHSSTSCTHKNFIQKRAPQLQKEDKAEKDGPIVDFLRPFIYPVIKVGVTEVSNSAEEHCCCGRRCFRGRRQLDPARAAFGGGQGKRCWRKKDVFLHMVTSVGLCLLSQVHLLFCFKDGVFMLLVG